MFSEAVELGDPTPKDLLRARMQKDAPPPAGFSIEQAVGGKWARESKPRSCFCQCAKSRKSATLATANRGRGRRVVAQWGPGWPLTHEMMERETGFEPATLSLEG